MEIGDVEKAIDTIIDLAEQLAQAVSLGFRKAYIANIHRNASHLKYLFDHLKPIFDSEQTRQEQRSAINHDFVTALIIIIYYAELLSTGRAGSRRIGPLAKNQAEIASKIRQFGIQLLEWSRQWRL